VKILLISPTQSGIGGIAQHVQGLTFFLKNMGHHIEIISSENTFTIPIKGLKNPSFMISSFLKAKFKNNQDIVHAHNIPAALAMKNSTGKKILSLHGIYSQQINQLHGTTTGNISRKYEKDALSWADAITVVSREAFDYYSNLGFNVHQIPNGIDFSVIHLQENRKFEKQIIFAGRLSKEKGIKTLIEICKQLPSEIHLLIIGDGPEKENIKKIELENTNIHYLGTKNHKETVSLIKGSDVLIQPSFSEGISSTILEAMACKTTVIASNIGGNPELIQDEKSGILIEPTNHEIFCKKIIKLMSDESLRDKLSSLAYETVKKYDWKIIGKQYVELYNSLL
jgi:glycosyltransferase involved in cell wall biosynthesis